MGFLDVSIVSSIFAGKKQCVVHISFSNGVGFIWASNAQKLSRLPLQGCNQQYTTKIVYKNNCRPESYMNGFVTGRGRGCGLSNVFGITRIRFIRFGPNWAWTYYLTLETSLRTNFSFLSKSKMAAGGQRSKIGQIWPCKSHFGPAFGSGSSNLDKMWHRHTT